jgi:hypothetical protein
VISFALPPASVFDEFLVPSFGQAPLNLFSLVEIFVPLSQLREYLRDEIVDVKHPPFIDRSVNTDSTNLPAGLQKRVSVLFKTSVFPVLILIEKMRLPALLDWYQTTRRKRDS